MKNLPKVKTGTTTKKGPIQTQFTDGICNPKKG